MQYSLPQFIEVEDKIIGPLTLKQFLILLGGGLLCLFYWALFNVGTLFFILTLPTIGVFAYIAFGQFNGRPVLANVPGAIKFLSTPRVRLFQRTGERALAIVKKAPPKVAAPEVPTEPLASRLRRLAYLLDQKAAEEERLIKSGQLKEKWLNQI